MNHSEDGCLCSDWTKSFRNMRGTLDYGQGSDDSVGKRQTRIYDVDKLSQKRLIRYFLCDGKNSSCVLYHTCECMKACKYGQRYLKTLEEKDHPKEKRKEQ